MEYYNPEELIEAWNGIKDLEETKYWGLNNVSESKQEEWLWDIATTSDSGFDRVVRLIFGIYESKNVDVPEQTESKR